MVHTDKHIMDVTLDDLYANNRKKACQKGCGVYCAVSTSLLVHKPAKVITKEIVSRARRMPGMIQAIRSDRPRPICALREPRERQRSSGDPTAQRSTKAPLGKHRTARRDRKPDVDVAPSAKAANKAIE